MYAPRPLAYAPTPYSYTPNTARSASINLDEEVKLTSSSAERDLYESLAEIYSIIVTLDGLEKAYIKDVVTEAEYTETCTRLLKQYKSSLGDDTVAREFVDLETFKRTWGLECPRATERLRIGLPATVEQASHSGPATNKVQGASGQPAGASGTLILTATENFITFLDALKLNMASKDALHPLLSDVIQSVNKVTDADFENRGKIIQWLIILNQMRATEELGEEQARELAFDIEQAYQGFKRTLDLSFLGDYAFFPAHFFPASLNMRQPFATARERLAYVGQSVHTDKRLAVLDLPQIHTKPSGTELLQTLSLLTIKPRNFGSSANEPVKGRTVDPTGLTRYLTSIIASPLSWLDTEELREAVWDSAAARLSERSGRTAMPAMSRVFTIPTSWGEEFTLTLHEPSLTSDNLGMKTWVSSYLLSQRLHVLLDSTPQLVPSVSTSTNATPDRTLRALELGAGTGLVGLSFAALRGSSAKIHLTDLPPIVPNLAHNAALNVELLTRTAATVTTGVLDWSVAPEVPPTPEEQYDIILAADPLYSPEHPRLLVDTIAVWLSRGLDARVVLEMPLRDAYLPQVQELRQRMGDLGLGAVEEGEEMGYDDWETADGGAVEVRCWWTRDRGWYDAITGKMVIGLLAITAIPTVTGISLGCSEQRKSNQRQNDEKRMAKFHTDVECLTGCEGSTEIHGKRVVLRDNKVYIDDPDPTARKREAHAGQAFYINYPEPDHLKHLKRGLGLVSTIQDSPPMLNWIYADKETHELKYGNRTQSCEHVPGPWDWRDEETTVVLEKNRGFYAVKEEEGVWAVYFDRDGDGLAGVLKASGKKGCLVYPIRLKRTLVELPAPQAGQGEGGGGG
ncbi:VPS28 protein-domain-containing protein [Aspergillus egyptiacus]|nr:VPS28 protein-domain-containing protein [Aspergillus egyptiacus]